MDTERSLAYRIERGLWRMHRELRKAVTRKLAGFIQVEVMRWDRGLLSSADLTPLYGPLGRRQGVVDFPDLVARPIHADHATALCVRAARGACLGGLGL